LGGFNLSVFLINNGLSNKFTHVEIITWDWLCQGLIGNEFCVKFSVVRVYKTRGHISSESGWGENCLDDKDDIDWFIYSICNFVIWNIKHRKSYHYFVFDTLSVIFKIKIFMELNVEKLCYLTSFVMLDAAVLTLY